MIKVVLKTKDGGMVVDREIPAFVLMPDILHWGDRSFVRTDRTEVRGNGDACDVYEEAFSYAIVDIDR